MKKFYFLILGIVLCGMVAQAQNSYEGHIVWRANLCATFLGNLVYPTPASKMLHFP